MSALLPTPTTAPLPPNQDVSAFTAETFTQLCDAMAAVDANFASVIGQFGYPPFWSRPNNYETMVHFILEQQVSLASALAAMERLRAKVGVVSPQSVMGLTDEELKAVYFSRQKIGYVRNLSTAVLDGTLMFSDLETLPDNAVRERLTRLKGIGNWTAEVYLIMVLHRMDVFPIGDIAVVNALKRLKGLPPDISKEKIVALTAAWRPHRTIATMLLWHYYLSSRKRL